MKKERNNGRKWIIAFAVFICLSMIVSIFAIVLDRQQTDTPSYNNYDFKLTSNGYKTKINGKYLDFQYYPSELERVNMSQDIVNTLRSSQQVAFIFDPNSSADDLAYIDFARYSLQTNLNISTVFGVTNSSEAYSSLPVVNCDNATSQLPFIMMNISSDTSFATSSSNPYCIIMNARLKDIVAAKDRLLYTYYGVMSS